MLVNVKDYNNDVRVVEMKEFDKMIKEANAKGDYVGEFFYRVVKVENEMLFVEWDYENE